jgi:ferritin
MIDKKMEEALNKQMVAETYSGYIYLAMAADFDAQNMKGFASWMKAQAFEELFHAMKFYDYINDRGGRAVWGTVDAPPTTYKSPLDAFKAAYNHEVKVTGMINDLVDLARSLKDKATENFLQWFVTEQVEEEAQTDEIVKNLERIKDHQAALFMYDARLGERLPQWGGTE